MKRREFITLLGGAAVGWPLAASAQQSERVRRIGLLTGATTDDPESQANFAVFMQVLQQFGWTVGQNVRIDYRYGGGDANNIRKYAAELAALAPDVILTTGSDSLAQMLKVTRAVPIVFVIVPDPVGSGFVDSLSRPGGNATGFMQFEYSLCGKWLELLKQIAPSVNSSGGPSGSQPSRGDRPVCHHPVRGAVSRGGGDPDQRARCRRDRARRCGIRALLEWRSDLDSERVGGGSS